jgi:nucleoside-diphosphate-sugar epimerase
MTLELMRRGWSVRTWDLEKGLDAMDLFSGSSRLYNATAKFDLVVHAAARSPHRAAIDSDSSSHIYNQLLDAAMFDWAVRTKQGRVLYLSSCAVLDAIPDDYGNVKLTGERLARQARDAGLPVTVVRPFSGYGEDQGTNWPFGAFLARAKAREDPFSVWGLGTQIRDWIHIDDIVSGALAVAGAWTTYPVSLCTGRGTSMKDLILMMCAEVGYTPALACQLDQSTGPSVRLGDPFMMNKFYKPIVTLEDGVRRALEG